jgi:hypothetical protein
VKSITFKLKNQAGVEYEAIVMEGDQIQSSLAPQAANFAVEDIESIEFHDSEKEAAAKKRAAKKKKAEKEAAEAAAAKQAAAQKAASAQSSAGRKAHGNS